EGIEIACNPQFRVSVDDDAIDAGNPAGGTRELGAGAGMEIGINRAVRSQADDAGGGLAIAEIKISNHEQSASRQLLDVARAVVGEDCSGHTCWPEPGVGLTAIE